MPLRDLFILIHVVSLHEFMYYWSHILHLYYNYRIKYFRGEEIITQILILLKSYNFLIMKPFIHAIERNHE